MILYFRFTTPEEIFDLTKMHHRDTRMIDLDDADENCIEDPNYKFITLWKHYLNENDKGLLSELHGGKLPHLYCGPFRDQLAMRSGFIRLSESNVRRFQMFDVFERLNGVPLIDSVLNYITVTPGAFNFPTMSYLKDIQRTRGVCMDTLKSDHEVLEVTCGVDEDEIIDHGLEFFYHHYKKDQSECCTNVVAVNVESIRISVSDWEQLPSSHLAVDSIVVVQEADENTSARAVPVRLILGGKLWTFIIRLDVVTERDTDGKLVYTINHSRIQPKLEEFMENLPTAIGFSVKQNLDEWTLYMRRLGSPTFKFFNGIVDCSSIAILAGFHSQNLSMFNCSVQILGGILLMNNFHADGLWGVPYKELPDEFKVYLIGDTRCSHHVYVILLASLLQELFPDADVACQLTSTTVAEFVSWFSNFVVGILKNLEYDWDAYKDARSRTELMCSLRVRCFGEKQDCDSGLSPFGELSSYPPEQIVLVSKIIPVNPTVMFGGARYLIATRKAIIAQANQLKYLEVSGVENIFKMIVFSPDTLKWITYGQSISTKYPSDPTLTDGLVIDPSRSHPVMCINPSRILNSEISQIAKCQGRPSRLLLLEWGRLCDPGDLLTIIRRASEEGGDKREDRLWFPRLSRYEDLRNLYINITGCVPSVECAWAEKRILTYHTKAAEKARLDIVTLEAQVEAAKRRLGDLESLESEPLRKRVKLESQVTAAPPIGKPITDAQRARRKRYKKSRKNRLIQAGSCPDGLSVDSGSGGLVQPGLSDDCELEISRDKNRNVEQNAMVSRDPDGLEVATFTIPDPVDLHVSGSFYSRVVADCDGISRGSGERKVHVLTIPDPVDLRIPGSFYARVVDECEDAGF